jgi:hypothetical protein
MKRMCDALNGRELVGLDATILLRPIFSRDLRIDIIKGRILVLIYRSMSEPTVVVEHRKPLPSTSATTRLPFQTRGFV